MTRSGDLVSNREDSVFTKDGSVSHGQYLLICSKSLFGHCESSCSESSCSVTMSGSPMFCSVNSGSVCSELQELQWYRVPLLFNFLTSSSSSSSHEDKVHLVEPGALF